MTLRKREYLEEARVNTLAHFQRASADVTKKCGEAYMEAVKLKGMFDEMEEIPKNYQRIYDRTMKVMGSLGDAKKEAYQSQMELRKVR